MNRDDRFARMPVCLLARYPAWHFGQKYVDLPACVIRSMVVLHRRQGFPARS
jgi:hypothetical protein